MDVRCSYMLLTLFVVACSTTPKPSLTQTDDKIVLLDPSARLDQTWEHRALRKGETTYSQVRTTLGSTVKATGNVSASILFRVFEGIDLSCDTLEWAWFVEEPQKSSDLRQKGFDDVGASIWVSFGDPGLLRDNVVPTLRYVWANETHEVNEIIIGPYQVEYVRTIVVRIGSASGHSLVQEKRNLVNDFKEAFKRPPEGMIYAVGIFTDNDDTQEPITAHYGPIKLVCNTSST